MHTKILFIMMYCLALTACTERDTPAEGEDEHHHEHAEDMVEMNDAQMKSGGIALGKLTKRLISGIVKVNGKLDVPPQQLVSVSIPVGGFLKSTPLLQGSHVTKGQVIAVVENIDFVQIQQDYLEAKGQLEMAESDYTRQQELAKENVNSQKSLQQSKANFLVWQAKYSSFKEKLKVLNINISAVEAGNVSSQIRLISPIDGYVTEVNANVGKFVTPEDVIFEIVDTRHLHAELIVFEKDVPKLRIGQKVRFTLANEDQERTAVIKLIGREIASDRTVQIHCFLDNEDRELLPGMYLSALVETGGAEVLALPQDAVVDYQGKKYVFVVVTEKHDHAEHKHEEGEEHHEEEEYHFKMIEVEAGNTESGFTEVMLPEAHLQAEVVVKGAYTVLSKLKNSEEEGGHGHVH